MAIINKTGFYLVIIGVLVCLSNSFMFHSGAELDDEPGLGGGWVLVERDITSNTYYNAETGQYKTLLWSGVANYQNDTGVWTPVNTSFEMLDSSHPAYDFGYRVGNDKGVYSAYFKPNLQQDWPISFAYNGSSNPTAHVLRSQLVTCGYLDPSQDWRYEILQNVQDASGSIDGNTATYTGAFSGVNVTFTYDNSLLKEDITLSNQTRTILENNPPSSFGLSNQDSYLVYATKLDYKKLYPYVDDNNMTGNFTVTDGKINFRNHKGIVEFVLPIGYAYEQYNENNFTKMVYRVIQYKDDYYLLAGVKVTDLYQMQFPIVIDPTTTLTYTDCKADISAYDPLVGFPPPRNYELMMRWDISSFVSDPDIVAMNMSYVHLYCYDDKGVAADADARIANISDQTWVLPSVAQYNAMSETTRDDANAFNDSSISTGDWVKCNVTHEVSGNYNASNSYASFRIEDLDYPCASNAITVVTNTTSLIIGRYQSRQTVPPSDPRVLFGSCSYATTALRPKLECIYYAPVNIPPTQTNPSPTNNSQYMETTPECTIYVDDDDGDTMNVYFYNGTDGSTWTLQQTNSSVSPATTVRWDYTQATSYSTDYYWKVAVNDTKDNTTAWYNFTTASNAAQEPISFTATAYSGTQINLTWTNYAKCENTYIEVNTSGGPVPWVWGSGIEIYNNTASNYEHTGLNYNTQYFYQAWGWNNTESAFSDENASDDATTDPSGSPAASNPNPADEEDDFNMLSIEINVTIEDPEGDPFDWTIETSPNVGSDSGNGESNGSKTCSVTLTQSKVLHTWWVNATDGLGGQLNQSYEFTTNWYPEMYNPYPVNMSINTEGTPTLRITINDTDADDLFCFMQSNYTGSWTSLESWSDIDMSGGEVTKTHIATVFSEPDTKYWWRIYLYDYYHITPPPFDFGGENISTYHFTTCSLPTISSASPANENMNETSPVTLSAYFEQPQGIVMNITWYDYESETVLETDSNKNNDTQTYVWTREAGTGEWNITVESYNFTVTSDRYWFANNQTWDDDFNNSFLADNLSGSDTYLIPLTDDSTCRYESWYDSTLSAGNEANVTIDAAMTDATLHLSYGKDTVFINDTHGYAFFSKGGTITVSNTTDGGSIWSASTDSGETSRTISVWWDGWIYNDNNTNNIIHCNIGTTDDDDVKYAKFWINNDTFSSWTTIHDFSANSDNHRSSICTTSRGDIWVGYYHGTTDDSYIKMSEDGGVTWTQMLIDTSNSYYSVYPLGDKGVMVLHCDDDFGSNARIYATYYLYSTESWSDDVLLVSTSNADEFVGHDAVYYDKEGELYFTAISNDYAAGAAVYFRKFWISNNTWSSSKTVANGYTTKSTIAVSQGTGDIYIAYMNGTLGAEDVYSVNSTDGGNTWGAESQISNINDDLRHPSSSYYGYERLYFTWVNDDLNDLHGCTVRTYTKGSSSNYWGNLTSVAMTKPTGYSWNQFFATGTEFTNLSFSILDSNNVTLLSGLDGDYNDISGISDATIRLFANFSNTSTVGLWNVTWTGPLSITINFAGNLSDRGGPYWRPPGESDKLDEAGEGIFRDGYYTNDSKQQEDWIYINTTVSAGDGTVDEVWLHWYNVTGGTWVNNSYHFVNTADDYYEYNTSGNIQTCAGFDYSFDIRANDTSNNILITWWNKTGLDGSITRRSVQLNCTTLVNISYTPFYFYNLTGYIDGASGGQDRFIHDQGMSHYVDHEYLVGQIADIEPTDAVSERHDSVEVNFWYNGTGNIQPLLLDNIYYHFWWSAFMDDLDVVGWSSKRGSAGGVPDEFYDTNISYRHSSIYYDTGFDVYGAPGTPYNSNYSLETNLFDVTDTNFTDNNIYEICLGMSDSVLMPSVISNRSFRSFVIFNIPDNATLNASHPDTDGDMLSDWTELYVSNTDPFVVDTDNDGVNDYWEHYGSSDPNNYTSTANDSLVFEINRTSFGFGTVQNDTIEYSNETGEADTLRIYNNGTCSIDIDVHGTNATALGVADWVLSPNNGDNLYKMEVYNVTTNWWQVNLTEDTWYTNMASLTNITANIRVTTPITFYSGKQMSCTLYMFASIH